MANRSLPQLHRKLIINVALTTSVTVGIVVATMWLTEYLEPTYRWPIIGVLVVLATLLWTSMLRRNVEALVDTPLAQSVASAEAIAAGDTARRVPAAETREFDALSKSVNKMTEQLLDANQNAIRVEKLATMGRLAAGIAHEVGNPLAAIANYSHIARTRAPNTDHLAEPLDALDREVERIDRIVRGLLDYARPRRLTPKPIAIDQVIRESLRLLDDQGIMRRVVVEKDLEAEDGLVYAERTDLEQLFVNLLLNAVDAMDAQGRIALRSRTTTVTAMSTASPKRKTDTPHDRFPHQPNGRALAWLARADRPDAVLQVVIADSGQGVAPEDEERIFEPFFSTKRPGKGTGLGLAIVARTVENLGGTVWVQRAREGGAAFVMLFPLHSANTAVQNAIRATELSSAQ